MSIHSINGKYLTSLTFFPQNWLIFCGKEGQYVADVYCSSWKKGQILEWIYLNPRFHDSEGKYFMLLQFWPCYLFQHLLSFNSMTYWYSNQTCSNCFTEPTQSDHNIRTKKLFIHSNIRNWFSWRTFTICKVKQLIERCPT